MKRNAVFIGYNAMGDTLCSTAVIRSYRKRNPETITTYVTQNSGFCRVLELCPELDSVIYSEVMYLHGLKHFSMEWLQSLPLDTTEDTRLYHFDMNKVGLLPDLATVHITDAFGKVTELEVDHTRPSIAPMDEDRRRASIFVRRPYVIFSMHSVTNPKREDGKDGGRKDWLWENWAKLAEMIDKELGLEVIAVGSESDARLPSPYIRNLYALPIRTAAALIDGAEAVVSLENGIAHMAAGLDAPLVHLYSTMVPLSWAQHQGISNYEVIFKDPVDITFDEVTKAFHQVLSRRSVAALAAGR